MHMSMDLMYSTELTKNMDIYGMHGRIPTHFSEALVWKHSEYL